MSRYLYLLYHVSKFNNYDKINCNYKFETMFFFITIIWLLLYFRYKLVYVSTRPGFNGETQEVIRRYSDFEWLSNELIKFYPGIIIPPLPEKQSVGNLTNEFVESRRRALEKFLFRIAIHPDLGYSTFFIAFLQKGACYWWCWWW